MRNVARQNAKLSNRTKTNSENNAKSRKMKSKKRLKIEKKEKRTKELLNEFRNKMIQKFGPTEDDANGQTETT